MYGHDADTPISSDRGFGSGPPQQRAMRLAQIVGGKYDFSVTANHRSTAAFIGASGRGQLQTIVQSSVHLDDKARNGVTGLL